MKIKVSLKNVTKFYKSGNDKVVVLNNISLDIMEGDFVVFMGPSGAGKTTLLFLIAGLEKPNIGTIYWEDIPINTLTDKEIQNYKLRKIGLVFQNFYLIDSFTALENVCFPMFLLQSLSEREVIQRGKKLLKMVGIEENRFDDNVSKFSSGQKQRIAIARALANDPDIIIADEPTGNLDTKNTKIIMELFSKINKELKKTIILSTHDPKVAIFSSKVILIQDGKISFTAL